MSLEDKEKDLFYTLRREKGSDLQIDIMYEGDIWIFRPLGNIDTETSDDLEVNLIEGITQGMRWIIIDLSDVPFISSSGLGVLIKGGKKIKEKNGEIILSSPRDTVFQIFKLSGFTKIFRITPDQKTAMDLIKEKE